MEVEVGSLTQNGITLIKEEQYLRYLRYKMRQDCY